MLSIVYFPHPTLRHKSCPVMRVDGELRQMVARMFDLMYEAKGVGLAANQVNIPLRFFVCNPTGQKGEGEEFVFINPILSKKKGSAEGEEGCLSLPGVFEPVVRPTNVHVEAYSLSGEQIELDLDGFLARVVQHEVDHLDGTMFTDRLSETRKMKIEQVLEEFSLDFRSQQASGQIPDEASIAEHLQKIERRYGPAK